MRAWLHHFKPAASSRTHLLLAAAMWTLVGTALATAGVVWLRQGCANPIRFAVLLVVAAACGAAKARFALAPAAQRIATRIRVRGEGNCLGGFLSPGTWGLVIVMSVGGRVLRALPVPRSLLGFLYTLIGTALVVAALRLWGGWRQ